jgi:hypothetical protein
VAEPPTARELGTDAFSNRNKALSYQDADASKLPHAALPAASSAHHRVARPRLQITAAHASV